MDQFRITLISIGVFAIVGILAHGMWTIPKTTNRKKMKILRANHHTGSAESRY